jgi:hypothetical protein
LAVPLVLPLVVPLVRELISPKPQQRPRFFARKCQFDRGADSQRYRRHRRQISQLSTPAAERILGPRRIVLDRATHVNETVFLVDQQKTGAFEFGLCAFHVRLRLVQALS